MERPDPALDKDAEGRFYEPLGEFRWEGHRTMEHISPEQALGLAFEQVQPGFTWGILMNTAGSEAG